MPKTFEQFQTAVDKRVQDSGAKLKPEARDECILQAILQRYSKDRPQENASDVNGNGTALLDLPPGFEDGFSSVRQLEYPIGNVPPTLLADDDWQPYRDTAALKIMLLAAKPTASEQVRVTWTKRHADDGSTVREADFEAVCDYAAALAFEMLAARHAQTGDATVAADTVNYRTKSQEFMSLAKGARRRYFNHIGLSEDEIGRDGGLGPALAIGEVDQNIAGAGIDRLTHPGRWR